MSDSDGETTLLIDDQTIIILSLVETPINITVADATPINVIADAVGPPGNILPGTMLHDYSIKGQALIWSGSEAISADDGNTVQATLVGNTTLDSITGWPGVGEEGKITLYVQQGAGPYTLNWPASILWINMSEPPTVVQAAGSWDVFALTTIDAGATVFGFHIGRTLT